MKYYLAKNCVFKQYDKLSFVFARTENPDNEFYELNCTGEILIEFIVKNNGATKEELLSCLSQNLKEFNNDIINEISEFLGVLLDKRILYLQ